MKNPCWMSLGGPKQHELGASDHCLMCAAKRAEDAARHAVAMATGMQRPAEKRKAASA